MKILAVFAVLGIFSFVAPAKRCTDDYDCPDVLVCNKNECINPPRYSKYSKLGDGNADCISDPQCPKNFICINEVCRDPCYPDLCGKNAFCTVQNDVKVCECEDGYFGNPHEGCSQRKCTTNDDCPSDLICNNYKCELPCPCNKKYCICEPLCDDCGANATCIDYVCTCLSGYQGDPKQGCTKI